MLRVSTNEYQKRLESLQGNLTAAPPKRTTKRSSVDYCREIAIPLAIRPEQLCERAMEATQGVAPSFLFRHSSAH